MLVCFKTVFLLTHVETMNSAMESKKLSTNELKDAFSSLKINNSPGYVAISFDVVKKCYGELYDTAKFIFDLSLGKWIYP